MKKPVLTLLAVVSAVVALTVISIGGASGPLADRSDVVVIKGKNLPAAMLGAPTANYALLAQGAAGIAPIPFQIDEYNAKDLMLMRKGPKAAPDSDNGAFDANDEVVFMAFDAGPKAASKPALAGCDAFAEIAVSDAKSGATGYAYLAKCSTPPAKSPVKYVSWDESTLMLSTESYKFGWRQENKYNYYYDYLSVFNGPDVLDKLKVHVSVSFKGLGIQIKETSMMNNLQGFSAGPVRVSIINLSVLNLSAIGKVPVHMHLRGYKDWILIHNAIDSGMNPAAWGLDYQVRILHDLNLDKAKGYKLCTSALPNCLDIGGPPPSNLDELTKKEIKWGGFAGPDGTLMTRIVMDPRMRTRSQGFYLDDPKANRKPEFIPGSNPEIGFYVVEWQNADHGMLDLDFYHFFMKKYSVAEVERFDRMNTNPLKAKAGAI